LFGECSKNGGVVETDTFMGFSSGVGFWSCIGWDTDGLRECGADETWDGACVCWVPLADCWGDEFTFAC
jgi:hypothetical protein